MTVQPSLVPSVGASQSAAASVASFSQFAPLPQLGQRPTSFSMPNIAAAARGSQIELQSEQEAKMASFSQFMQPDDILHLNPIAKAVFSLPDEAIDEKAKLGKYIPELYARQEGKISEIRSRMSYQEFISMYMRMIMAMQQEAPEQVPERLIFLHNIARKAVKYRWNDVRFVYTMAMKDLKRGERKWSDDLKDITDDELPPSSYQAKGSRPQSAFHSASDQKFPLPFPCKDYNDKVCVRPVCKFFHNCTHCSQPHPAKHCPQRLSAPAPVSHA